MKRCLFRRVPQHLCNNDNCNILAQPSVEPYFCGDFKSYICETVKHTADIEYINYKDVEKDLSP